MQKFNRILVVSVFALASSAARADCYEKHSTGVRWWEGLISPPLLALMTDGNSCKFCIDDSESAVVGKIFADDGDLMATVERSAGKRNEVLSEIAELDRDYAGKRCR